MFFSLPKHLTNLHGFIFFIGFFFHLLSLFVVLFHLWLIWLLFCCGKNTIILGDGVNNNKLVTKIFFSTCLISLHSFEQGTTSCNCHREESDQRSVEFAVSFYFWLVYYHATLLSGCFFIISIRFVYDLARNLIFPCGGRIYYSSYLYARHPCRNR